MSEAPVEILVQEILRWNHQISLVSRVDARQVTLDQVDQCRRAWTSLACALPPGDWGEGSCWVDVGSGSGLPGLVWAALRQEVGAGGETLLVEPREKRAWFLNRAARAMGLEQAMVQACRWGEEPVPRGLVAVARAVVSFKALRMSDGEVLAGFGDPGALSCLTDVAVVRFLWPEAWCLDQLAEEFGAGVGDGCRGWGEPRMEIVGDGRPGLLVTRYRRG